MSKRTLDGFFAAPSKKQRTNADEAISIPATSMQRSSHKTYPWPVPHLPADIVTELEASVTAQGRVINSEPHLDLVYFQPFIPKAIERELFNFLRSELFFYRVKYSIKRFGKETQINTPRYTTVFGVDETSRFAQDSPTNTSSGDTVILDSTSAHPVKLSKYKCAPRPIPECLDYLRRITEANTDTSYNFCLVNYYATGTDSISFHSDDEYFLGPNPAIASFTLGAQRDFVMKHKPPPPPPDGKTDNDPQQQQQQQPVTKTQIKLPLSSGDMVLMRGPTQSNWLHSVPKRKDPQADRGRINITLRRAMIPAGTENYYRYNVGGGGGVYKWNAEKKEMMPWGAGPH